MNYFPIFAELKGRPVLLVGAGEVAERKAESLLNAGALPRVVAPSLSPAFRAWEHQGQLEWIARDFDASQLEGVFLVVCASGSPEIDERVFSAAEAAGKLCNTVDTPAKCSFITPAVIDRSPVQVAISTSGTAPVIGRYWKQQIEKLLPMHTGALAKIAGRWRARVHQRIEGSEARRKFWEQLFASRFEALVAAGRLDDAEAELQRQLDGHTAFRGEVSLISTGPGDPGLLTLNALHAMQAADIVFIDADVPPAIRQMIRKDAERIMTATLDDGPLGAFKLQQQVLHEASRHRRVAVLHSGHDAFAAEHARLLSLVLSAIDIPLRLVPGIQPDHEHREPAPAQPDSITPAGSALDTGHEAAHDHAPAFAGAPVDGHTSYPAWRAFGASTSREVFTA